MCAGSPVGSAHAYLTMCQRPESMEREHMSGQEGRVPQAHLDLEDTRLRYDTYQLYMVFIWKVAMRLSVVTTEDGI